MENRDRSKNITIAMLIIVIIVLSATCIWLVLSKKDGVKEEKKDTIQEEEKKESKEETIAISDSEKDYFMEIVNSLDNGNIKTAQPFETSKLTNQEKLDIVFAMGQFNANEVSYDKVLSSFQKVFGKGNTVLGEDYQCPFNHEKVYFKYDASNKKYVYNNNDNSCVGEADIIDVVSRFESGEITKKNGEITGAVIKVRKSYSGVIYGVGSIMDILPRYGTYQDAKNKTNIVEDFTKEFNNDNFSTFNDSYFIQAMEKRLDKYPVHTYTFTYFDGSYNLVSFSN